MASSPPQSAASPASPGKAVEKPVKKSSAASSPARSAASSPKSTEQAAADNAHIEVDESDNDSGYEPSVLSDTTSLKSSMRNYQWEHGRRYHAETDTNKYWGPNDDKQQEAEDLSHEMHKLILDGQLHEAPLEDPQRVLEVGCGTGAWAIDFADEYPSADVIGIDISPIQPAFVPPNCRFEVDDMNKEWTFPENHFDYVHLRSMLGTTPSWEEFHKTVFRHVKPGGWVEHVEISTIVRSDDDSIPADHAMLEWGDRWAEVGEKIGYSFRAAELAHDAITNAGFINVTERILKIPIGRWPRDKRLKAWGQWYQYFLLQGIEGFALRSFVDVLEWTYERAQVFLMQMRQGFMDPNIHSYSELRIIYGQKPE